MFQLFTAVCLYARGGRIYCRIQFPGRETGSVPGEPQVRAGPRREDIPPNCGARPQGQPLITQLYIKYFIIVSCAGEELT
jgi:hypothetical protein